MDDQTVELIRDQFSVLHEKIDALNATVRAHVEKDERYWGKIDEQAAQMKLIKFLFGGTTGSAIIAWIVGKLTGPGH